MTKKEKIKKFLEEHKDEIKVYAIAGGGALLLGGSCFALGKIVERRRIIYSDTAGIGLLMNKASEQVLIQGDIEKGIGKVADIPAIVAKGLEEAGPEGHLDDTVVGYMVYTKK